MFTSIQDILRSYRQYWAVALISVIVASVVDLLELVVPYTIGQVVNVLSDQPPDLIIQQFSHWCNTFTSVTSDRVQELWILMSIIFLVSVIRAPIQSWVVSWLSWVVPIRATYDEMKQAIAKVLSLPLGFYEENNPGRIIGLILQGVYTYTSIYPSIVVQLLPKLVRILGIVILMAMIEWRIALLFLLSFIFILGFSIRGIVAVVERDKFLIAYQEKTHSRTSEIITNIKTIKAFGSEDAEFKGQSQRINRYVEVYIDRVHKRLVKIDAWRRVIVQTCNFCILALALWGVMQDHLSIGHLITIFTLSNIAHYDLYPISQASETFVRNYPSLLRFHTFMQQPVGQDAAIEFVETPGTDKPPEAKQPYQLAGKIEFSNLSFGYDAERLVLENINLLVEPCQTIALVGRSGAGKSTLVKLLFRYFEPSQGKIIVDRKDIQGLDVARYRRCLAIVHQEVDVFNGTLLDNVRYGDRTTSFEQAQEVCRLARVDEFIDDLPNGYHTLVGEQGVRLSGGQRQRLGIARALLVNPNILVFDEATSSLDYESERSIQLAMQSILGTRTTIIIAHRLSTVREADKIVVLDRGKIVEVGNHQELLAHGGVYKRLYSLQDGKDLPTMVA